MKQQDYLEIIELNRGKHRPSLETMIEGRKFSFDRKKDSHDYSEDYLTFIALEDGTFTFTPQSSNVISYSTDNGTTWIEGNSIEVNNGDKVMWKGTMTPLSGGGVGKFTSTGNFDVQGNIMSLLYGDNFKGQTDLTGKNYVFYQLFYNNTKVVNAENLSLPATTVVNNCYNEMFRGCTSLVTAPSVLPATTLAIYCYDSMFRDCTSLVIAPTLPATTLIGSCYADMFRGCTNLTTVPSILPATTLEESCYFNMFNNCTSLTTAPELPATTLVSQCYYNMFISCTSLNYIKAMFTTTPNNSYTYDWVRNVASSGTFVKNSAAQWDVSGINGIPTGWTVETATE